MIDTKYQCNSPASIIVSVLSLRDCQIACLADLQCRTTLY
jgi:hypothetical protein